MLERIKPWENKIFLVDRHDLIDVKL